MAVITITGRNQPDVTPVEGRTVRALAVGVQARQYIGGTWTEKGNEFSSDTTDVNGDWSVDFPVDADRRPVSAQVAVDTGTGNIWAGSIEGLAAGTYTLKDMVESHAWRLVHADGLYTAISPGPTGPAGPIGPTGPVIGVVGPTGAQGVQGVSGAGALPAGWVDESTQASLAAAITASVGGRTIIPAGTITLSGTGVLSAANEHVHLVGDRQVTLKLANGSYSNFMDLSTAAAPEYDGYHHWRLEGLIFDGNARSLTAGPPPAFNLTNSHDVQFVDCDFRDLWSSLGLSRSRNIRFTRCRFFGAPPGAMQTGVQDPPAIGAAAVYRNAITIGPGCENIIVDDDCEFHYCANGLTSTAPTDDPAGHVLCADSRFRGDWHDGPLIKQRFTATAYNTSTLQLTAAAGTHFDTYCTDYDVISFRRTLAASLTLSAVGGYNGSTVTLGSAVSGMMEGDVLETTLGLRGVINAVASTTQVDVPRWESIATHEEATPPVTGATVRVVRYYASTVDTVGHAVTDTTCYLANDPVNPRTGERAVTDAGLTLTALPARILGKLVYSGVHLPNVKYPTVRNCHVRGPWADAISVFFSDDVTVDGNLIEYTQDMGLTLSDCPHGSARDNTFRYLGTGLSLGSGSAETGLIVEGNHIHSWACTPAVYNYGVIGLASDHGQARGNVFTRDTRSGCGGRSTYAISVDSCVDAVVEGNTDGGSRTATLTVIGGNPVSGIRTDVDPTAIVYQSGATSAALDPGIPTFQSEANAARYASFGAAVDAIGSTETTLVIDRALTVAASKTVPATLTLRFTGQGRLNPATSQTITINKQPIADRRQIFGGAGAIAFGPNVTDVEVEWFGAKGDGTNEPVSTLQAAVNAFPTTQLFGKRLWARGDYKIDGTLLIENRSGLALCGIGHLSSRIRTQATVTGPPLRVQNCETIILQDFHASVGGTSRGVIEFVRAPSGTYGNWGHRGMRLFVDTDGSGVTDYNLSWYCSTPGTEKTNNDTGNFTDCTLRGARIGNIEMEGANASFHTFLGGEMSYAPTMLHLKGGEVHIIGAKGQGNGATVRSGGTYNDTSKQYAVTDTTGMRAGDYFAVHTTSSIDSGACYPIASIVDSTHLTLTGNPYNGGGNKTGLYFAWMAPLIRMEVSPYTGESGYIGTLCLSNWTCEANGQALRVHDDGVGNPVVRITDSTLPFMLAPGTSGNYYRHIDWTNAGGGGRVKIAGCLLNGAPAYAFTEMHLDGRAALYSSRIDTARVSYGADLTVIDPSVAPTYNNLGSGTLHTL